MRTSNSPETSQAPLSVDRLFDADVHDSQGDHVGRINAVWTEAEDQVAFLGVKTSWLAGKTHVVPVQRVEINQSGTRVRIPYTKEEVKQAPAFDPDCELDENRKGQILSYYRTKGGAFAASSTTERQPGEQAEAQRGSPRQGEEATIVLKEEQVKIGKRQVEAGGVLLRKVVRTETVNQPVELQREEIEIERIPAEGAVPQGQTFEGEEIYIPLRREEPVVEKETRAREQVRARKKTSSERRTVEEHVRKEDVEVEQQGATGDETRRSRATGDDVARASREDRCRDI